MNPDQQREYMLDQELTEKDIKEQQIVIDKTLDSFTANYWEVNKSLKSWKAVVEHQKVIYDNLNKCRLPKMHNKEGEYMQVKGWVPTACLDIVNDTLTGIGSNPEDTAFMEEIPPLGLTPPTLFLTNSVTEPFLLLVEKYGVARYKEVNPALFAMAFFSFQFGIMFGDLLHGGVLTIVSILMLIFNSELQKSGNEIVRMVASARWMILLCGVCATYMGLMYNEIASLPLDLFGSSYTHTEPDEEGMYWFTYSGSAYPVGLDPAWRHTANHVMFTNSLKMKMAVIIGILQMTFGVILKLVNARHGSVGDAHTAVHESIPELIIYTFPFFYLIFLIVVKWNTDWENVHQGLRGPPSVLNNSNPNPNPNPNWIERSSVRLKHSRQFSHDG